jgi:hypothetical protein
VNSGKNFRYIADYGDFNQVLFHHACNREYAANSRTFYLKAEGRSGLINGKAELD